MKTFTINQRPCPHHKAKHMACWAHDCQASGVHRCAKCRMALYCSKDCQAKDWRVRHKRDCQEATLCPVYASVVQCTVGDVELRRDVAGGMGRGLFARRAYAVGDVVFQDPNTVAVFDCDLLGARALLDIHPGMAQLMAMDVMGRVESDPRQECTIATILGSIGLGPVLWCLFNRAMAHHHREEVPSAWAFGELVDDTAVVNMLLAIRLAAPSGDGHALVDLIFVSPKRDVFAVPAHVELVKSVLVPWQIIRQNGFGVCDQGSCPGGSAWGPVANMSMVSTPCSMMNHSCMETNVAVMGMNAGAIARHARDPFLLRVTAVTIAVRPIAAGQQLFVGYDYGDDASATTGIWDAHKRKLMTKYGVPCTCPSLEGFLAELVQFAASVDAISKGPLFPLKEETEANIHAWSQWAAELLANAGRVNDRLSAIVLPLVLSAGASAAPHSQ